MSRISELEKMMKEKDKAYDKLIKNIESKDKKIEELKQVLELAKN